MGNTAPPGTNRDIECELAYTNITDTLNMFVVLGKRPEYYHVARFSYTDRRLSSLYFPRLGC